MVSKRMKVSEIFCDECNAQMNISRLDKVYHCPADRNEAHAKGYDICSQCFDEWLPNAFTTLHG